MYDEQWDDMSRFTTDKRRVEWREGGRSMGKVPGAEERRQKLADERSLGTTPLDSSHDDMDDTPARAASVVDTEAAESAAAANASASCIEFGLEIKDEEGKGKGLWSSGKLTTNQVLCLHTMNMLANMFMV